MKTKFKIGGLFLILGITFALNAQNETFISNRIERVWTSKQDFKTPESVLYNPFGNYLFVANIDGKPGEKDNIGFISKVDLEGNVKKLRWVEGISAPKGMAMINNKLFVSNIDELVEIDIEKAKIIRRYSGKGAKFLNDVAVDKKGNVYVSGMTTNKIYCLHNGEFKIWNDDELLQHPNGLYFENEKLLVGCKNYILEIDLNSKKSEVYVPNTGSIDGLKADGKGNYIISDWSGHVYLVNPKKEKVKLLDTTPLKINAADIEFIPEKNLLFIPTFFDDRVVAYKFK